MCLRWRDAWFACASSAHRSKRAQSPSGGADAPLSAQAGVLLPVCGVHNPQAYLYRAACNTAMDMLDARRRHQGKADFELQMDVMADGAPGPAAIAEAGSDLRALGRVLEGLPKLQSSVLLALRIDERPRSEVAQQFGISLRKVDRALAQALAFCAEQMHLLNQA